MKNTKKSAKANVSVDKAAAAAADKAAADKAAEAAAAADKAAAANKAIAEAADKAAKAASRAAASASDKAAADKAAEAAEAVNKAVNEAAAADKAAADKAAEAGARPYNFGMALAPQIDKDLDAGLPHAAILAEIEQYLLFNNKKASAKQHLQSRIARHVKGNKGTGTRKAADKAISVPWSEYTKKVLAAAWERPDGMADNHYKVIMEIASSLAHLMADNPFKAKALAEAKAEAAALEAMLAEAKAKLALLS